MATYVEYWDCWKSSIIKAVTFDGYDVWSCLGHIEFRLSVRVDDDDIYAYRSAYEWEIEEYGIWKDGIHYKNELEINSYW